MSWTDAIEDRWGGRQGTVRLAVRLVGIGVFGYLLFRSGAFRGPLWVAIGTGVAIGLTALLLVLRSWRPFDRATIVLTAALMVLGVVLNPTIDGLGSVFFVIGGLVLVGQPEVPMRVGLGITGVLGVALVVRAVAADPEWTVLLSNLFGAAAVLLVGANGRQRALRRREAARVSALEERSRIARDLHDVLAHSLGGLVVQLDAAEAELEQGRTAEATARVRTSRQLAVDGLREARAAVDQLRSGSQPHAVDGPVDLVEELRVVLHGPVGVQLGAELEVVGRPRPVDAAVASALAATAREALTNANKHAPGTVLSTTLVFSASGVRLEIVNGLAATRGEPSGDLAATGGGAGLPGLRDRLRSVGGRLQAGREGRRWVVAAECPDRPPAPSTSSPVEVR